ncbi:MAG: hypothetical protein LBT46_04440 [Planctomycetaceae bacterium]|jgi:hypothetical protein|nr:hypothetical protein [Planctomycetaceae bacterium]
MSSPVSEYTVPEDAVALRFAPRRIPVAVCLMCYQHCLQAVPALVATILGLYIFARITGLDGIGDAVRQQYSPHWKPAGVAKVLSCEVQKIAGIPVALYETNFEFDTPDRGKQNDSCGSFWKKYEQGKEYPLESLQDKVPAFRLTGSWTAMFRCCLLMFLVSGSSFLFSVIYFGFGLRQGSRNLSLCRYGIATIGTFTGAAPIRFWSRVSPLVHALIEFRTGNGEIHNVKVTVHRSILANKKMRVFVDTPAFLFYDADIPEHYLFLYQVGGFKTIYDFSTGTIRAAWGAKLLAYVSVLFPCAASVIFMLVILLMR